MSLTQTHRGSDEELLNCIDRGLEKVGPNVRHLVFWHLQKIGRVQRKEILDNPEKFVQGLSSLYHESAPAVERAILLEINTAFESHYSLDEFSKAIIEARQKQIA
jgi:hypothetical protein